MIKIIIISILNWLSLELPTSLNLRKYKWQVHSFNDIRELNQIIRKGTKYYKIDLYYVPR